jgi:hypothetical protein
MWMTEAVRETKRQLRDVHGFVPSREVNGEPCFDDVPDGSYAIWLGGRIISVQVIGGYFHWEFEQIERMANADVPR